jgi:aryl sulfotransferase
MRAVRRRIEREYRNVVSDNRRWNRFVFRPGDVVVCTPPKCGTTWMQMIVASLIFPDGLPAPLWEISPWFDARFEPIDTVAERLDAQTHRRSIKTHTPADGIPWTPDARYIVVGRDGRDAIMSLLNHMQNLRISPELVASAVDDGIDLSESTLPPLDDVHAFFTWCVDDSQTWFKHVATFWPHRDDPNVLFVHYNDLLADLEGQMRRVSAFADLPVDERGWGSQVERCTFESMRAHAAEIGDFAQFEGGAATFLYKGTNGRWRDILTSDELERFDRRLQELLPPDAIAWTTSGNLSTST